MCYDLESIEPDIQVVVTVRGAELAMFGLFRRPDQVAGFDAVAGVAQRKEVGAIESLLNLCIEALHSSSWLDVDSLSAYLTEEEGDQPF